MESNGSLVKHSSGYRQPLSKFGIQTRRLGKLDSFSMMERGEIGEFRRTTIGAALSTQRHLDRVSLDAESRPPGHDWMRGAEPVIERRGSCFW